uniref:Uncharacterized protein n=1 Tax=Rhizophora mucronata TaxID=61149 RepID=A0A2P2PEC6_RHIMU
MFDAYKLIPQGSLTCLQTMDTIVLVVYRLVK